ncbi:unnamed protein product [Pleuronectes platessa]|uniref:Uncharacterized protein n=1 Tax=Pleuronectes platessa TaxID=8262 RepID=A0A9N7UZX7_PLEPL|nr:unnamed protein product [Pleuronectes platessa]
MRLVPTTHLCHGDWNRPGTHGVNYFSTPIPLILIYQIESEIVVTLFIRNEGKSMRGCSEMICETGRGNGDDTVIHRPPAEKLKQSYTRPSGASTKRCEERRGEHSRDALAALRPRGGETTAWENGRGLETEIHPSNTS